MKEKRENENNNIKKNRTRGTKVIAKGWEINDFVECLS